MSQGLIKPRELAAQGGRGIPSATTEGRISRHLGRPRRESWEGTMQLIRRAFDWQLTEREIHSGELLFRLRTVWRLKAGESEPFGDPSFDPYLHDRRPAVAAVPFKQGRG